MDPKTLSKAEALAAYHDCKTEEQRAALYWSCPLLQQIYSQGNHPKPVAPADPSQPTAAAA